MLGRDLKDVGRFFSLWEVVPRNAAAGMQPSEELYNLALEMALESRSAKRTVAVLEEFCEAQVYPTPRLAERLARAGRHVVQIHHLVGKILQANRQQKAVEVHREGALLQTHLDEREIELASEGKTVRDATPEQEVRSQFFRQMEKRGAFRRPWLPYGEYLASKAKGGEAYAKRHDRPRPNLLGS